VLPSQWLRESPHHWRMLVGSVHDDVALPALAHVVENRDAAGSLHDPAEAAGRGAEFRQSAGQAAIRQRAILRIIVPRLCRVVAARRLGEPWRGVGSYFPPLHATDFDFQVSVACSKVESKLSIGSGGFLRLGTASWPACCGLLGGPARQASWGRCAQMSILVCPRLLDICWTPKQVISLSY
jgi:hypothetical protein